jgi:hypothetical protein
MNRGNLVRAALAAAACFVVLGGARAHAEAIPGAAERVLTLVNQERTRAGVAPLSMDPQLTAAAQKFSEHMASANFYSHNGPDGSTPLGRMNAAGFAGTGTWGENIAAYYSDADAVMQVWMASPGHRANILNPAFTHIGIGVGMNPNSQWKYYWTQDFGVRRGAGGAGGPTGGSPPVQPQPQPQPQGPVLQRLEPAQGAIGQTVALIGQHFGAAAGTISFSGTPGRIVSWSNTRIEAQVPQGAASGSVYVQNSAGTSSGVHFTVLANVPAPPPAPEAPQATTVYPNAGSPGARVTVYGRGFGATAGQVLFNGVPGQIAFWYDTLIGVNIPASATSGPLVVRAAGGETNALAFTVQGGETPAAAPQLVYCSPSSGAAGTQVSVLGRNLGDTAGTVSFNGIAATVVNWTDSAIVVIVPQGATTGPVTVQVGSARSNAVSFTVISPGQPLPQPAPAPQPQPQPQPSPADNQGSASGQRPSPWSTRRSAFGWLTYRPTTPAPSTPAPQPAPQPAPAPAPQPAPNNGAPGSGGVGVGAGVVPAPVSGQPTAMILSPAAASAGSTLTISGSGFGPKAGWVRVGRTTARILSWTDTAVTAQLPAGLYLRGRVSVIVVRPDYRSTQPLYLELTP